MPSKPLIVRDAWNHCVRGFQGIPALWGDLPGVWRGKIFAGFFSGLLIAEVALLKIYGMPSFIAVGMAFLVLVAMFAMLVMSALTATNIVLMDDDRDVVAAPEGKEAEEVDALNVIVDDIAVLGRLNILAAQIQPHVTVDLADRIQAILKRLEMLYTKPINLDVEADRLGRIKLRNFVQQLMPKTLEVCLRANLAAQMAEQTLSDGKSLQDHLSIQIEALREHLDAIVSEMCLPLEYQVQVQTMFLRDKVSASPLVD